MVATDGLGELAEAGAALAARALELSSAMGKTADYVTLAVTGTKEGTTVVSSSEKALRPAVRALLKPGEVAAKGAGHAEVTGVNAARQMGLTPTGVAASRGICPSWRVAQVRLSRKRVGAPCLDFQTWDVDCWHDERPGALSASRQFSFRHVQLLSAAPESWHGVGAEPL